MPKCVSVVQKAIREFLRPNQTCAKVRECCSKSHPRIFLKEFADGCLTTVVHFHHKTAVPTIVLLLFILGCIISARTATYVTVDTLLTIGVILHCRCAARMNLCVWFEAAVTHFTLARTGTYDSVVTFHTWMHHLRTQLQLLLKKFRIHIHVLN